MPEALIVSNCGCDRPEHLNALVPVEEAVRRAQALASPIKESDLVNLADAIGRALSRDVHAPRPMPFFDNSAMDGFAVRTSDLQGDGPWIMPIAGPVAAGETASLSVSGNPVAVRIFTGAPVPHGFDAVIMQEDVGIDAQRARFINKPVPGQNVRLSGEDIARGAVLIKAGARLQPRHIGLLAANGYSAINVLRKPRVGVFSTGDELVEAGGRVSGGQIFDANRPLLLALAAQAGADVTDLGIVGDNLQATAAFFGRIRGQFDLVVSSGAVSVGGHDFVKPALERAGGDVSFWRVAMKPGKPVMFGRIGETLVAGLPGNSLAAHIGFRLFVDGMIARLSGQAAGPLQMCDAVADFDWIRRTGRTEYFPVRHCGTTESGAPMLERLGNGGSASLYRLCHADGIAVVAADVATVKPGDALRWMPGYRPSC